MNRNEATDLLQRVARRYPGKVTITRDTLAQWADDLAAMTVEQAENAWAEHRRVCPHPVDVADLWAAHRHLTLEETPPEPRRDSTPSRIELPSARMAPDVARAELAKMRATLEAAKRQPADLPRPMKITGPLPVIRTPNADDDPALRRPPDQALTP